MTLLDVRNQIFSYFTDHDVFTRDEFLGIIVPKGQELLRDAMVQSVLDELEESDFVRQIAENCWTLVAPLGNDGQEVHLSLPTCLMVSQVINNYLRSNGSEARSDTLSISEFDIQMLVKIIVEGLQRDPSEN